MKKTKPIKRERKNKNRNKSLIKIILAIIIILSLLLVIMIVIQFGIIDWIKSLTKEPKLFVLKDECSLIMNNLFHTINDENNCKVFCTNHCQLNEMRYHSSEFVVGYQSCNTCNCYCK
jgi:hypothetical protein